jgi:uncharacterized protein YuzE
VVNVTIGNLTFDHSTYDADGDVLYLGAPVGGRQRTDTEGHVLRFDADGRVIGLTIISARWLLERDGELTVTLAEQVHVSSATLEPVLAAA